MTIQERTTAADGTAPCDGTGTGHRAVGAAQAPGANGPWPVDIGEDAPAARGGHVLAEAEGGAPDVVLVATGADVHIALAARDILQREGTATRVVSMPCAEKFQAQSEEYRDAVLPPGVRARISVEAGVELGWYAMLGGAGQSVGLAQFGVRAPYRELHQQSGLTAERVAAAARTRLHRAT
ncbi:transketolase-like TK C-terminal-containing protein [Streptomyces sp. NPDC052023]|uniref:transketolase-like TK C-terminal-containing protein n=1 Tax=Streptomyces sp. NPDC052023 TaxID=3365681 RepID=UPI0037D325E9